MTDRRLSDQIAHEMAAGDPPADAYDEGAALAADTDIMWSVPDASVRARHRAYFKERGFTDEKLDLVYPMDDFIFMIQSCLRTAELVRLRASFVRHGVAAHYIEKIDEILGRNA